MRRTRVATSPAKFGGDPPVARGSSRPTTASRRRARPVRRAARGPRWRHAQGVRDWGRGGEGLIDQWTGGASRRRARRRGRPSPRGCRGPTAGVAASRLDYGPPQAVAGAGVVADAVEEIDVLGNRFGDRRPALFDRVGHLERQRELLTVGAEHLDRALRLRSVVERHALLPRPGGVAPHHAVGDEPVAADSLLEARHRGQSAPHGDRFGSPLGDKSYQTALTCNCAVPRVGFEPTLDRV